VTSVVVVVALACGSEFANKVLNFETVATPWVLF
jgi:hypothetical protein